MRYDAQHWARSFIDDLILCLASEPVAAGTELGAARSQLLRALSEGKRIALFLDYDGTLREIEREPRSAEPSPAVHALLQRLRDRSDLGSPS
jgi:trehalose 6-phosphate synthase/phosphatase